MERLERVGLRPYVPHRTESFSFRTPNDEVSPRSEAFESPPNSLMPSRAPSEHGEEERPHPHVTEGGSQSSIMPLAGHAMDLVHQGLRQGVSNAAYNIPNDAAWAAGHATRLMRTGVSNMAHNIPNDTRRIVDASTRLVKGGVDLYLKATDPMS